MTGIAAKAQFGEVYAVLAEEVVAHPHVGEAPPCEGVGFGWWLGLHCVSLGLLLLPFRSQSGGMYMPNASWRSRG
jgi:hypothetical protein